MKDKGKNKEKGTIGKVDVSISTSTLGANRLCPSPQSRMISLI